ncbi:MAG: RES domain-containing protein [Cytophagales bacterium]|nr:MAG: RES domain-containing protein [Cytophagales bacterium]TAG76788.1 MAG: RES domain-containing protein [Cytophagales bacterium]
MEVYRISLAKWTGQLVASGGAARWNSKGKFVIYTAATRALACLENVVHRSGEGLNASFKTMIIDIPDTLAIAQIAPRDLPKNWSLYENYHLCQKIGDNWLDALQAPVLQVPSAIIGHEFNFLLNPQHPDFKQIVLKRVEDFAFDVRIKQ